MYDENIVCRRCLCPQFKVMFVSMLQKIGTGTNLSNRIWRILFYFKPELFKTFILSATDKEIEAYASQHALKPNLYRGTGSNFGNPSLEGPDPESSSFKIREAIWKFARESDSELIVHVPWFGGVRVPVPLGTDSSLGPFIFAEYEPTEMFFALSFVREGSVVVDGGSNDGWYSLFFAQLVGSHGTVVAVDANRTAIKNLLRVLRKNNVSNVRTISAGLGSEAGIALLKVAGTQHSGHSTFGDFIYTETELTREEPVDVFPLDDLLTSREIQNLSFIKLDIEGAELTALRGMDKTLRASNATLLIEINLRALNQQCSSGEMVLEFLKGYGYEMFCIDRAQGRLIRGEIGSTEYALFIHKTHGLLHHAESL